MADTQDAALALERRLAAASRERGLRADRLAEALLARAKPQIVPVLPAATPEPGFLPRLRDIVGESLYTDADAADGAKWLGSDPFRLRELPLPAHCLAGLDTRILAPEHVAPLLRGLSLTRPIPDRLDLGGQSAAVSRNARTGFEIPRVLHAIWFGGAPAAESPVLRNLGYAARRYAGEVAVVLWTDLVRGAVPGHLLGWAAEHDVALLNVFELFHADSPMITHAQCVLELAKQLPRGYAAASDLARLEIVYRFGGVYADADLEYADQDRDPDLPGPRPENLVEFLDRLAESRPGFTMDPLPQGGIGNDIAAAPARHRVIRLWLEETRVNYFRSHAQIFGGLEAMALPYVGEERYAMRYVAPYRTGRVHHRVLNLLGLTDATLPATQPPFRFVSRGSWIPIPGAKPPARRSDLDEDEVLAVLERCLTVLEWQSVAREGDLYLATIDPVVRTLPDPGAAWIALLTVLPTLPGAARITSVTDVRRRDDHGMERIELPPEAQALIDRHAFGGASGAPADWLGAELAADGGTVAWLVDERVEAAALRDRTEARSPLELFARLTEVAHDASSGEPVGLWIRPDDQVRAWRHPLRFAYLPSGWFGISLGGPPGWDWREHWPLDAETIAGLVLAAGAAGRPVVLSAPWDVRRGAGRPAALLGALLDQPVKFVDGPLGQPNLLLRPSSSTPAPELRYLPLPGYEPRTGPARTAV